MRTRQLARAGAVVMAATAALVVVPQSPASAETCGDDGVTRLFDPAGQYFDFTDGGLTPDRSRPFAALYDSGGNGPTGSPPGPRANNDAFDRWGALFVGGTGLFDMYFSATNDSCASEEGGAERVYPVVTLHGLQVQRKLYVRPSAQTGGLPGVRILDLLTNNGATAVTTSVQVGDLADNYAAGLGSDENTAVRASSSGDLTAAAGDTWFVTSDHTGITGNSDPALAFVVDGPGALTPASTIQVGGGSVATPEDNLIWRHQVTIAPGETVALMSFVVQADAATSATQAVEADALAASRARAYLAAPADQLYTGMSAAEIAALRNWNDLEITSQLVTAPKQRLRRKFKAQVTCPEESCAVRLGGALKVGKTSFKLQAAQLTPAAGVTSPITLKVSKKAFKKVLALLERKPRLRKKVRVTFTGTATDLDRHGAGHPGRHLEGQGQETPLAGS